MNKRILASLLLVSGHCIAAESGQLSLAGGSNLSGDAVGLQVVTSDADASVELINQVRGNPVALETLRQEFYQERKAKKRNNRWYKKIGRGATESTENYEDWCYYSKEGHDNNNEQQQQDNLVLFIILFFDVKIKEYNALDEKEGTTSLCQTTEE